jgi:hypothetical protein
MFRGIRCSNLVRSLQCNRPAILLSLSELSDGSVEIQRDSKRHTPLNAESRK